MAALKPVLRIGIAALHILWQGEVFFGRRIGGVDNILRDSVVGNNRKPRLFKGLAKACLLYTSDAADE